MIRNGPSNSAEQGTQVSKEFGALQGVKIYLYGSEPPDLKL